MPISEVNSSFLMMEQLGKRNLNRLFIRQQSQIIVARLKFCVMFDFLLETYLIF